MAGTAKRATTVVLTVAGDPNAYETWVVKGQWGTLVNPMPAGTTQICAEAFDAGVSIGRTCITYTAAVDGQYLSLFPDDGASVQSTFTAGGGCHGGSTVRLTLDGRSEEIFCDSYQYYRRYVDVPEGEHTLTVEQLALDGSTVVASITHTFTSAPVPVATVEITSPQDGSVSDWTELVISGTESSNVDPTVQIYVDGVYTTGATATDGQWSAPVTVDWGTHEICARKTNWQGDSIADDCIVHTVELLDTSLSITSPGDGSIQQTFVAVEGTCVGDLYVELAVDGEQDQRRQCLDGRWSTNLFLADGPHTLTARMSAGGTTVTDSVAVTVDSVPPATPIVVTSHTRLHPDLHPCHADRHHQPRRARHRLRRDLERLPLGDCRLQRIVDRHAGPRLLRDRWRAHRTPQLGGRRADGDRCGRQLQRLRAGDVPDPTALRSTPRGMRRLARGAHDLERLAGDLPLLVGGDDEHGDLGAVGRDGAGVRRRRPRCAAGRARSRAGSGRRARRPAARRCAGRRRR